MLGKEALSEEDRVSTGIRDSFRVETRTVNVPEVPALNSNPGMLGKLRDPRTGMTRAAFFSQILLPGTDIDLGDPADLVLDSAVLSLRYAGFYGDTSTSQEFVAHQVVESMEGIDPSHTDSLSYSANEIGSKEMVPKANESVELSDGESLPPHLRIPLKDAFGEKILDRSGDPELSDDVSFTQFINGIRVSSTTNSLQEGEGAVLFVEPVHDYSRITLYYRNTAENDTNTLNLEFGGNRFNQAINDPSGSDMAQEFEGSFSDQRDKEYVLGPGEVATEMRFPNLKDLVEEGDVSVNRAILKLPVVENAMSNTFPPSNRLHIFYEDQAGELQLTKDLLQDGEEAFNGFYDPQEGAYRMRITRHVQEILNGTVKTESLFVSTTIPILEEGAANTVSRSVLKGPGSSEAPTLEVIYTEY